MCSLFLFSTKNSLFWENLFQKIKIVSLSWNLVPTLIRICRIQWCCSLFPFLPKIPFLGIFGLKNQNCQFKLKFGTYNNSNMQNSMVMLSFWPEIPFLGKSGPKNKNCHFRLKFGNRLIWLSKIQWRCSLVLFSTKDTIFGQIWLKKIKILNLRIHWRLIFGNAMLFLHYDLEKHYFTHFLLVFKIWYLD